MIRSPRRSRPDERRSGDELRTLLEQQAALAELGRLAVRGIDTAGLAQRCVRALSDQLGVPLAAAASPQAEGGLRVVARIGPEPEGPGGDPERVQGGEDGQSRLTLETREVVVSRDLEAEDRFAPNPVLIAAGAKSCVSAPVGVEGEPYGVLLAASLRRDDFSAQDVNFVETVATTLGAAVSRERAQRAIEDEQERLREALRHASQQERRFRDLADSAPVFIWTSDRDGLVDFINRGWLDFTGHTLEEELGDTWGLGVHPDDEPGVEASWTEARLEGVPWEREYRLLRRDGVYRWIVDRGVPVYEEGELTGYVGTATDIHERKEMEERLASAYERDHEVAETLQRSMLPERMPQIEGVEVEARYLPASTGQMIGGDWYDALELDDGRVAVVVGDVVGHGLRAASIMGQLRNAFRAYAVLGDSPATTLGRLNRLLMKDGRDLMATALYVLLDRDTGNVSFASAGHPPALALAPGGATTFLEGGRSVPLGTSDTNSYVDAEAELPDGATLLLYTDGLVERRDSPLEDRLSQLAGVAAVAGGGLGDVCDQILAGALAGQRPTDDVALIAVRPAPAVEGELSLRLPADPASLVQLRRRLGRFLHAAGASASEEFDLVLAVSEAAMNAIEHAYGPGDAEFGVKVRVDDGELIADVRDHGSWRDQRDDDRGRGVSIMEALTDDVDIERGAEGTTVRLRRRIGTTAA